MAALETVDIPAVEILASGGPVHAVGSPPEGDFYTRDQLVAIAAAHNELGDEIRAPIKIGHSDRQQLAANSGLTAGEMPALGWLDPGSFRVEDDADTGVAKLVADAKTVPAKLATLMESGAYRTRSSEIRRYASQVTQKTYDWVVDGLALLGANVPAIQTLDDVYRLYERAGIDKPTADVYVVRRDHAAAEVVWDGEDGFQDLIADLQAALNPGPGQNTYWVSDVSVDRTRAIVSDWDGDKSWVVPFTVDDQGEPTVSPSTDWILADDALIRATNDLARKNRRAAEPRLMEVTLTAEQEAQVREHAGLDADTEVTAEAFAGFLAAGDERANELAAANAKIAELETRKNEASGLEEKVRKLEADVAEEQQRRFEMERDADLSEAVRDGRIDPAQLDDWRADYEESQAGTRRVLARLKPDPDLVRELGRDGDPLEKISAAQERHLESQLAEVFPGYDPREVNA